MNITLNLVRHWGRVDRYPTDPFIAEALKELTGTSTVTLRQQNALLKLGHTFTEIDLRGR